MKLLTQPEIRLNESVRESMDLYVHDLYIGTLSPEGGFPLHPLIGQDLKRLDHGVAAVSIATSQAFVIDISDFVKTYLTSGGIVAYLQALTNAGKWELYSTYLDPSIGVVTAYFGVLLTAKLKEKTFLINCHNADLVDVFYYYDKYLGNSHWFMPDGCVIGVCAKYKIKEVQDYLAFDITFQGKVDLSETNCYRTKVGFVDNSFFTKIPDIDRIHRVSGPRSNEITYLKGGLSDFLALKAIASKHGIHVSNDALRILDWGVGCGRIARRFAEDAVKSIVFGIDIDSDNVDWCKNNLNGEFSVVPLSPPINFESGQFDLIYSCSVLSHLTEEYIDLWLSELNRILRSDGLALLSFNGSSNSAAYLSRRPEHVNSLRMNKLFDSDVNRQLDGFISGDEYYRATFATDEWWRQMFNVHFELVDMERSVVSGHQHIAVLRKRNYMGAAFKTDVTKIE
jgi:SAM-dependent methyltransferase